MRDTLIALLILAAAVGWFSVNGPREAVDGFGLGPGDDRVGESPLVVSGPGTKIVSATVTQGVERQMGDPPAPDRSREDNHTDTPNAGPEEETQMSNVSLILVGYAAGVAAVLIGMFAGPVVARMWAKIRNNHT